MFARIIQMEGKTKHTYIYTHWYTDSLTYTHTQTRVIRTDFGMEGSPSSTQQEMKIHYKIKRYIKWRKKGFQKIKVFDPITSEYKKIQHFTRMTPGHVM